MFWREAVAWHFTTLPVSYRSQEKFQYHAALKRSAITTPVPYYLKISTCTSPVAYLALWRSTSSNPVLYLAPSKLPPQFRLILLSTRSRLLCIEQLGLLRQILESNAKYWQNHKDYLQGREFCLLPLNFGCYWVELRLEFGSVAKLKKI